MKTTKTHFFRAPFYCILGVFLLSVLLRIASRFSAHFADCFNETLSSFFRRVTAALTGWFPFSLAEILVILIPLFLFLLIFLGIRSLRNRERFRRFVAVTLSIPMILYSLFVLTYGIGYQTTPLPDRLSWPAVTVEKNNLYETALFVAERAMALSEELPAGEDGTTEMPYDWEEMTEKLNDAYEKLSCNLSFLQQNRTTLKPVYFSGIMAYTGIVGVYSFFTGESNVNTVYPNYSTAFTAAHEMAHQRGIARENEANFIAFLALAESEDPFLRYAGYRNLLDYLENALYATDNTMYASLVAGYNTRILTEDRVYYQIYCAHRSETIRQVADSLNDSYLKAQGTAGTVTYSLVVDLSVRYYVTCVKPDS